MKKIVCDPKCDPCGRLARGEVTPEKLHPEFGFELAAVPKVLCLMCSKPIGNEPYNFDKAFARFGDMFFYHRRCK